MTMKWRTTALKWRLLKIVACLGVGILLFFAGYMIAGQIGSLSETQLTENLPIPLIEKESVVHEPETMIDPAVALVWLPESLVAVDPEPNRPQLAIVIDDFGQSLESAENFASLPISLTFAVFPKLYNSRKVARYFIDRQCDIMLHMPMEPCNYPAQNPGPDALLSCMSEGQMRRVFVECLESLPGIIGVNNHMGSYLTADSQKMAQVMDILKSRNLFFLDSRTIASSVAYKSAIAAGIPALQRDVFFDNVRDVDEIVEQFETLIEIARVKRSAIGIGHPYPETLKALALLPKIAESAGVEIVAIRKLLNGDSGLRLHTDQVSR